MGEDQKPGEAGEATGKIESKSEAKKDFVPSKGLTTAGERGAGGSIATLS
jgi:hypothetical protein